MLGLVHCKEISLKNTAGLDSVRSVLPSVSQGHGYQRVGKLSTSKSTYQCPSDHGRSEEIQAKFLI